MEHVSKSVTLVELKRSLVPPKWEDTVRVIGMSECKEAGLSLAHAFAADDLSQYLLDADDMASLSAESKWKLHVDIMVYIAAAHCLNGIVTTIGPDHDAVALWMPPGKDADGWWTILRSGLWRLYFQLTVEARRRYYDELLPLLHDTKLEVMGERDNDCYYLVYLGTKPNARGKGYARKLLNDMIERADAENRAVYLESSSLANNAYYRKFGFEYKREIRLTRGDAPVSLFIMVREPCPRGRAGGHTYSAVVSGSIKMQINAVMKETVRV
ncbi:acetyltransferase [Colletotrichum falcatum]|nr:acetyltransferase [Colletotrichum falcatum]